MAMGGSAHVWMKMRKASEGGRTHKQKLYLNGSTESEYPRSEGRQRDYSMKREAETQVLKERGGGSSREWDTCWWGVMMMMETRHMSSGLVPEYTPESRLDPLLVDQT
jgi:hypothetical protein